MTSDGPSFQEITLRILHIIATLDPQAGGPSNSVRRIVATYPSVGSVGEVVTLDPPSATFLHDLGFTVHALGPASTKFGFSLRLVPWLKAERGRFDGVVVHGLWQYLGFAVRRAIHPHKPYLVFTHGMLDPYFKRAFPMKHLKKTAYWVLNEYWVLRHARQVLFTSETESQLATTSFWPHRWNGRIVPYGATGPIGDPVRLRAAFLARCPDLRQPDGSAKPFILFLGRIHVKKGCDLLLEAFSRIAARAPELQLVFAGPDKLGMQDGLMAQAEASDIRHRVHWTGMLDGDLKWGAFYSCEAFSLPSHQENFGIAVAEALACGKPVLLSDKVNIWEEIAKDRAAFVGPDTTAGTLATLEQWSALSHEEKAAMAERALDCFKRRYDLTSSASAIITSFTDDSTGGGLHLKLAQSKIGIQKHV
jgi:glycosyltransferase involved in cell wall biosynthesis